MKIQKSPKNNKLLMTLLIVVVLAIAGYAAYAVSYNLWPFATTKHSAKITDESASEDSKASTPQHKPNENNDGTSNKPDQPVSSDYVDVPISNPPKISDPYPIQNEHYKITQDTPTSYHITLYPIVNNPEHSDYNAQLKAYKKEALDYLMKRYGAIDNFNIKWAPSNAESV